MGGLHLLGIHHRTIRHFRTQKSPHFKALRNYPKNPRTLGEHVRKKRIALNLSMPHLARLLGVGFTDTAIEKWEKNQNRPTAPYRSRLVEFLGFDPEDAKPTGDT